MATINNVVRAFSLHAQPIIMIFQVNKVGDDEDAFPETQGVAMQTRQKSMGNLSHMLDAGQSFEEDEEDEGDDDDDNDDDNDGTSLASSLESAK